MLQIVLAQEYKAGWMRLLEKLGTCFDDQFERDWKGKAGVTFW
ncbi:MAG TPA: hypothetical protein VKF36_05075 [Syntrophorhabdales bacterium]|nr:hypothetical protein [Syntrophorhabdales bacterium]